MELVKHYPKWSEFEVVCELTLRKVVPRLLLPLQAEGRVLKPSLIHAFIFDACSFYGHNEYDVGNWRAPRHRLSKEAYIHLYKQHFPVSEPAEDWDARNRLYSLCFNMGNIINIHGSQQHQV
jgi:protein-ribulosamine 3-kinase